MNTKFLGVTLCQAKTFKCDWVEPKNKFHCNCNVIFGRLGTSAPAEVILKLINSQGVQNLLYGISAVTLSESDLKSFSHAYNSMFAKTFQTFDNNTISCCQYYSGYLSFNRLYDLHRYIFLCKLINNLYVDKKLEIDRPDYRDYMLLQSKYAFKDNDSVFSIRSKVWEEFREHLSI